MLNISIAYLTQLNLTYVFLSELCSIGPYKGAPLQGPEPENSQILRTIVTNFW